MKNALRWALAACILSVSGCAYFNTFYNAKRFFNRGYKEVEKARIKGTKSSAPSTPIGSADFQKSIEKSLKLLDYYPKSKYADDALLMLGKAYYQLNENQMALRRFQEMLEQFPQSELRFEAQLGMAKAYVALKQFDDAEAILSDIIGRDISSRQKAEAYFYRGKFFETKKDFRRAVESYEAVLKTGDKTLRLDAQYAVGDNCDSLKEYDGAVKAFSKVIKLDPQPEIRFDVEFRLGVAMKNNREYDGSIKLFERLLGDEKNKDHEAEMRLEIGDCLARKGDIAGAITTYRDVIQLKQKPDCNAKAYYELGNIYQNQKRDYGRAFENFARVKKESSRAICADSAEIKARDIQRMQALQTVIGQALYGEKAASVFTTASDTPEQDTVDVFGKKITTYRDSPFADSLVYVERIKNDPSINNKYNEDRLISTSASADTSDSSVNGAKYRTWLQKMGIINWRDVKDFEESDADYAKKLEDGRRERIRKQKQAKLAENPELKEFKKEELDKNLFLLAELYLFQFVMPDSALNQYRLLVQRFPKSPYALQSLYNMHYIHRTVNKGPISADSTLRRILAEYPNSNHAKSLRKEIGIQSATTEEDTASDLFAEAERLLLDQKDPAAAIQKYRAVYEKYPGTGYAPKAFYAAAWAYENGLDSLRLATALYDSLLRRFPNSPFTEKVRKKIEAVKEDQRKAKEPARTDTSAAAASPPAPAPRDSTSRAPADSLARAAHSPKGTGADTTGKAVPPAAGPQAAKPGEPIPAISKSPKPAGGKAFFDPDSIDRGTAKNPLKPPGGADRERPGNSRPPAAPNNVEP
jgi:tetratricopeptide (TPR) repeat protein